MVSVDDYWSKDDNQGNGEQLYFHPHDTEHQQMKPSDMLFQTDWNWLMPVTKKCLDVYHIEQMNDDLNFNFYDSIGNMDATYKEVVEFIKEQKL